MRKVVFFERQVSTSNNYLHFFSVLQLVIHLDKSLVNYCHFCILLDVTGNGKHEQKGLELNCTGKITTRVKICTVCRKNYRLSQPP